MPGPLERPAGVTPPSPIQPSSETPRDAQRRGSAQRDPGVGAAVDQARRDELERHEPRALRIAREACPEDRGPVGVGGAEVECPEPAVALLEERAERQQAGTDLEREIGAGKDRPTELVGAVALDRLGDGVARGAPVVPPERLRAECRGGRPSTVTPETEAAGPALAVSRVTG